MKSFLVTGANGFVGTFLCSELKKRGFKARAVTRSAPKLQDVDDFILVKDIADLEGWTDAFAEVDVVIHLAARVHVMKDNANDPLIEFRKMNVVASEQLARSAAAKGVKRFVYVSSIKVNGEATMGEHKFSEQDLANPQDPYGITKWEAEQALHNVAEETGLELVIIRPPLVYGAGVKGNFKQMLRIVSMGIPLPLASIKNRRDLIYVENLVDALITSAIHPDAVGKTFLVSDGEAVSTPSLLRVLAQEQSKSSWLFAFPIQILNLIAKLVGKSAQVGRLTGSLQIDSSKIRRDLSWVPPYTLKEGLQKTVRKINVE